MTMRGNAASRLSARARAICNVAFVVAGQIGFAHRGQAQSTLRPTIEGTVRDKLSHTTNASVSIQLTDSGGQALSTTISDSNGRFRLHVPSPGSYRVRATRPGYLMAESSLMNVGEATVVVDLELTRGVWLDSVVIVGERDAPPLRPTQQLIRGRLVDEDSGEPLENGTVELRGAKDRTLASTTTDADGFFRLVTPAPGVYALRGRRIGYQPSQQNDLRLRIGDTVRVEFRLSRSIVMLDPVLVTGSARPWNDRHDRPRIDELYDRMKRFATLRHAQFILRDTLDAYDRRSFSTGEMLARVIVPSIPRGPACSGSTSFVDGLAAPYGAVGLDQPAGLDFIEVYTFPTIPAEFAAPVMRGSPGSRSAMVSPCRVVSYWTRPRERRR